MKFARLILALSALFVIEVLIIVAIVIGWLVRVLIG